MGFVWGWALVEVDDSYGIFSASFWTLHYFLLRDGGYMEYIMISFNK